MRRARCGTRRLSSLEMRGSMVGPSSMTAPGGAAVLGLGVGVLGCLGHRWPARAGAAPECGASTTGGGGSGAAPPAPPPPLARRRPCALQGVPARRGRRARAGVAAGRVALTAPPPYIWPTRVEVHELLDEGTAGADGARHDVGRAADELGQTGRKGGGGIREARLSVGRA
jgi:hypothetical protein